MKKTAVKCICLTVVGLVNFTLNASVATGNVLNLVTPVVPPTAVVAGDKGACDEGHVLQENGFCCPAGTSNKTWEEVCTPPGITKAQIFRGPGVVQYCPRDDMYIVSDKNNDWISCAAGNSTVLYPLPDKHRAYKFCLEHGYGYLLKIKPRADAGCIKHGDSLGDGCIEAGTCIFQ
jgi:hypothetical protein